MYSNLFSKKYPNFTDTILFFGLYFILSIILDFTKTLIYRFYEGGIINNDITDSILYTSLFIVMIIIISIYRRVRSVDTKPKNLLRKPSSISPRYILWGIISIISVSITINPIIGLFSDGMSTIYDKMFSFGPFMLITCIFVAPIVEELLFRGIIQSDFQDKYGATTSIIVSSLIFSIIHIIPVQIVAVFFTSLIIGLIYYKTKSLWSVIFIHFFNNALSILTFKLYPNKESFIKSYKDIIQNDTIYYSIYTAATIITVYAIYKIITLKTPNTDEINSTTSLLEEPSEENITTHPEDIEDNYDEKTELIDNNFIELNVNDEDNKI